MEQPPTTEQISQYNIILFSSIALVFIFYFSAMALVNMVTRSLPPPPPPPSPATLPPTLPPNPRP